MKRMTIVTTPDVGGKRIVRTLGMVRGNSVRARHIGRDIMAGMRMLVGGDVHEYAKLLSESRELRNEMGEVGREFVSHNFSAWQFQEKLITTYSSVVTGTGSL